MRVTDICTDLDSYLVDLFWQVALGELDGHVKHPPVGHLCPRIDDLHAVEKGSQQGAKPAVRDL